jgi:hypothetical protein
MKGQQLNFSQFFNSNNVHETKIQRPRNFFMPERNELLVHRYYFYVKIKNYRYEKCLEELEKDVFITAFTQTKILSACSELLSKIMQEQPSVKELANKFPRLNWNF